MGNTDAANGPADLSALNPGLFLVHADVLVRCVSFGPFHLGHLPEGEVDEIPGKVWREQLGISKPKKPSRK